MFQNNNEELKEQPPSKEKKLKRGLKQKHVELISVGGVIGSCYFLGTGYIISNVGPSVILSYLLGGAIVFIVMYCLAELAVIIPTSTSFVSYAAEFISPAWACGAGWTYWLNWIAYIPAECTACGIIMHLFFSQISVFMWSIFFGLLITIINLSHVRNFGEIEYWLAIIKIIALGLFSVLAVLIFLGIIHNPNGVGFIGGKYIFQSGGFFPKGIFIILTTMVMLLVNFQGSEIIGLAAGESKSPVKTIPKAVRGVTIRIIMLYVVPIFLLTLIFPWEKAGLKESVFGAALSYYNLKWAAGFFTFVVLTAAISCANSGMYGTVRALYGLSVEGMAPSFLKKLNNNHVPVNATYVTLGGIWLFLLLSHYFSSSKAFAYLLSISGFTGAICWISICWSQYNFRKLLLKNNYTVKDLKFYIKGFPITTLLSIWLQVGCLLFTLFNKDLRPSFYFGVPALIIPILVYRLLKIKYKSTLFNSILIRVNKPKEVNK